MLQVYNSFAEKVESYRGYPENLLLLYNHFPKLIFAAIRISYI